MAGLVTVIFITLVILGLRLDEFGLVVLGVFIQCWYKWGKD
jgi:hypothetical protein